MVQATFVSTASEHVWEVRSRDQTLCHTPCTRWISPLETYELRTGKIGFMRTGSVVEVTELEPYAAQGSVQIHAEPRSTGKLVGGIVTTSVGAAGVFFGGLMALLGCGRDEQGLCTGGLISTGIGVVAIGSGAYLILTSAPGAELRGDAPSAAGLGPNYVGVVKNF